MNLPARPLELYRRTGECTHIRRKPHRIAAQLANTEGSLIRPMGQANCRRLYQNAYGGTLPFRTAKPAVGRGWCSTWLSFLLAENIRPGRVRMTASCWKAGDDLESRSFAISRKKPPRCRLTSEPRTTRQVASDEAFCRLQRSISPFGRQQ